MSPVYCRYFVNRAVVLSKNKGELFRDKIERRRRAQRVGRIRRKYYRWRMIRRSEYGCST